MYLFKSLELLYINFSRLVVRRLQRKGFDILLGSALRLAGVVLAFLLLLFLDIHRRDMSCRLRGKHFSTLGARVATKIVPGGGLPNSTRGEVF